MVHWCYRYRYTSEQSVGMRSSQQAGCLECRHVLDLDLTCWLLLLQLPRWVWAKVEHR